MTGAIETLERMQGGGKGERAAAPRRSALHGSELIAGLLDDSPHRKTSDPSGVLLYLRSYQRSLEEFGPDDPDTDFLLACLLIRLDRSEQYEYLLEQIQTLGIPAFSALHNIFEQIPEQDLGRRPILRQARILWARMLPQMKALARRSNSG